VAEQSGITVTEAEQVAAHAHSFQNRDEVLASDVCGCFFCLSIFPAWEIHEWHQERAADQGVTAFCPRCEIDAIIGSKAGYPLTADFLQEMHRRWFES
jgi:hypothetical protein